MEERTLTTATRERNFTEKDLISIREKTGKPYWIGSPMDCFWEEIEAILRTTKTSSWEKLRGPHIKGNVWQQDIGEYRHKHTVHQFAWIYTADPGEVIGEHGHEKPANRGKQVRKFKEWYIFPDGTIRVCSKGETHRLVNNYGGPINVLSIKVGSNSTR